MILLQQQNYKDLCTASDLQPAIYKFSKIITIHSIMNYFAPSIQIQSFTTQHKYDT